MPHRTDTPDAWWNHYDLEMNGVARGGEADEKAVGFNYCQTSEWLPSFICQITRGRKRDVSACGSTIPVTQASVIKMRRRSTCTDGLSLRSSFTLTCFGPELPSYPARCSAEVTTLS